MNVEVELVGLKIQPPTSSPVLILQEVEGERRIIPIFIGGPEAHAIDLAVSGKKVARPMTHDLFVSVLEGLGAHLENVSIDEVSEGTFYANLHVNVDGNETVFSSRASDAVALATRTSSKIFMDSNVIDEVGMFEDPKDYSDDNKEEDMVIALRQFLDEVNPEDFSL